VLLAELNVRHTRRHMPTRRVAVEHLYLPTSGPAYGGILLGAVVSQHMGALDEEQLDALGRLVATAKRGALSVPRIALRYRLQTDTHGLELSRHRILGADPFQGRNVPVLELDCHGRAAPQVIGAVMAAAELPPSGRQVAFRFVEQAILMPGAMPKGFEIHRRHEALPGARPMAPGAGPRSGSFDDGGDRGAWTGVPADRRWAMEVLGFTHATEVDRTDVQRRFRRLVRLAHPDHGAEHDGAAERMSELTEARELLLGMIASADASTAG
jgi:hypothetical protein